MPLLPSSSTVPVREGIIRCGVGTVKAADLIQPDYVRAKNRRKRYLDLHPEYTSGSHLELADPLLYDRLIRRHQTPAEREQESRSRGYTENLEADLVRSEAKLEALRHPDPSEPITYRRAADGIILADDSDAPKGKEQGQARWDEIMRQRFLKGEDFDYAAVDGNDEYDDRGEEDRLRFEEYLGWQEEEFVGEGRPVGETGVLDY